MPPKLLAKNTDRPGVLPVNAAARAANKQPTARLKLEIRRLPPGLTLTEFESTLGPAWKPGNGRVDWREYRQGKMRSAATSGSNGAKAPEQSRCYIHVMNEAMVKELEQKFLEVVFLDAAGTHKSLDLKHLPPVIGFAPNQRIPLQQQQQANKPRVDNRQGMIDQDPEFIAFLESETQPIVKPAAIDAQVLEKEVVLVKSTPLIDDLREKKANKAKAALAKAEKSKEKKSQGAKEAVNAKEPVVTPAQKRVTSKGQKGEQTAKETSGTANKQASTKQQQQPQSQPQPAQAKQTAQAKSKRQTSAQQTSNTSGKQTNTAPAQTTPTTQSTATTNPAPQKPSARQRCNTDGIKKMLQKDLGIKPKTQQATSSTASTSAATAISSAAAPTSTTSVAASSKKPGHHQDSKQATANTAHEKKPPLAKAYLKHANPSQGMTEALIQSALAIYGTVTSVSIDSRKGTAVAIFNSQESLKKALEAKRVQVANGAVEVLEFRERAAGGGGRGGSRAGRGGSRSTKETANGGAHSASTSNTAAASSTATPTAAAAAAAASGAT